jgi:hypothetical protein
MVVKEFLLKIKLVIDWSMEINELILSADKIIRGIPPN